VIHETIQRVTDDIERDVHFNTAVSAIMELVNALHVFDQASLEAVPASQRQRLLREAVETVLLLLAPFCPHLTEELWAVLGHRQSLFTQAWPTADPQALTRDEVTLVVQVDGKVRSRLTVDTGAPDAEVQRQALADVRVQPWLAERQVARVVVVPNRLVNIVTHS
jgi:leucyl-tRNA synthetase